jgi:hypothetical protein
VRKRIGRLEDWRAEINLPVFQSIVAWAGEAQQRMKSGAEVQVKGEQHIIEGVDE